MKIWGLRKRCRSAGASKPETLLAKNEQMNCTQRPLLPLPWPQVRVLICSRCAASVAPFVSGIPPSSYVSLCGWKWRRSPGASSPSLPREDDVCSTLPRGSRDDTPGEHIQGRGLESN